LAAAANHPWLSVHRKPRVAILATGDEIAMPGEPIPAGGIVSSNSHALAAMVRAVGGEPTVLPVAKDTTAAIAAGADLVVDFWQIAMRPGKPLLFGRMGEVPVLGLPGNPVSAMVCAALFLLPALALMQGLPAAPPPTVQAILGGAGKGN